VSNRSITTNAKSTNGKSTACEAVVDMTLPNVLHALSDPVRLHIVRFAAQRERACGEFELDLPKATLSHHFKVLRNAGVIVARAEGTRHLISVNRKPLDAKFPGLMRSVLASDPD
jgi:DNA-binding transcriptional ArsR family regulator